MMMPESIRQQVNVPAFACVFPGQGSQSVGMLSALAAEFSLVRTVFDEVSDRLHYDVWQLVQSGPAEQLNQTVHTQVAMLAADVAVFRILESRVAVFSPYLAGHSLGEYAALVCAGVLSLADAAALVQVRGQLMQEAVPTGTGAMAAIVGLTNEQVERLCQQASSEAVFVSAANYNAIGQIVIAGHTAGVNQVILESEALGARLAKLIPVSVPCHCALLNSVVEPFRRALDEVSFATPQRLVMSSIELTPYTEANATRQVLANQLHAPVRWVETVQALEQRGATVFIECGPGKVLTGLIKRINKTLETVSVNDPDSLCAALDKLCA